MFSDPDNDPLTWSLTLENGDPLPGWMNLDPSAHRFYNRRNKKTNKKDKVFDIENQ